MRIWIATAAVALLAGAAFAQAVDIGGYTQRFISPCGQPWRAGDGEPYPLIAWFNATDVDHDGSIDLAEFRRDHERFFDMLDQDHNGVLDGVEISFYEKRIAPDVLMGQLISALPPASARSPWGGQVIKAQYSGIGGGSQVYAPPTAQGPGPDLGASRSQRQPLVGSAVFGLLNDSEPVTSADANLDGRVTKAEFLAAADRRFKRLDRNGDGKLTLDELPKPQAQVMAEAEAKKHAKRR
jgi:hypothetical protein